MDSRFLIIAHVGDHSQHASWRQGEKPQFDLFINYAGKTAEKYKNDGTFYEHAQGDKWPALAALLENYWELISTYDAVWFPSDGLQITSTDINRLFHLFDGHQLALAEPSLDKTLHPASLMRFVSGIGAIAPLFSRDNLAQQKTNFALDHDNNQRALAWCEQTPNTKRNQIAIIDAVSTIDLSANADQNLQPAVELYGQYTFQ